MARPLDARQLRGLAALAAYNGNARKASEALAEQDLAISKTTLGRWKLDYPDDYARAQQSALPGIHREFGEKHAALVAASIDVEWKILERLDAKLLEIPARDLPGAQRNVATSAGIHSDKAARERGEPVVITRHEDVSDIIRAMKAAGLPIPADMAHALDVVDGTAEELPSTGQTEA